MILKQERQNTIQAKKKKHLANFRSETKPQVHQTQTQMSKETENKRQRRPDLTQDGVDRVHGDLVLGCITDQTLGIGEGDVRRRGTVSLVVGNDLDPVVLPYPDARVGRAEIDPDRRSLALSSHRQFKLLIFFSGE